MGIVVVVVFVAVVAVSSGNQTSDPVGFRSEQLVH